MTDQPSLRLNKHLALQLGISRREADELIERGQVTINDSEATLGARFHEGDSIAVKGEEITDGTAYQYLLFNKPVGYVCSRRNQGDIPTIYALLPKEYHTLKPVGRLDKDSSGLLLLSNDGNFTYRMTHPKFAKTKVYEAQLDHELQPLHQQMISDYGVQLEDGVSKFTVMREEAQNSSNTIAPASSSRSSPSFQKHLQPESKATSGPEFKPGAKPFSEIGGRRGEHNNGSTYQITMHEGRNRQIRRTFAALGYTVTTLHRTHFGNYSLGDIKPGEYKLVDMQ